MKVHTKLVWDRDGREIADEWVSYEGPIARLGGGSSKTAQNTTAQTSTGPWSAQQPYLTKGFEDALSNYQSGSPQYYPDSTVTPFSDTTKQGMGLMQGLAQGSQLPQSAADQAQSTINGNYVPNAGSPLGVNRAAGMMNPFTNAMASVYGNSNANVRAGTSANDNINASNPNAGQFNPLAGVSNPYMSQDPNAYIGNVTNAVSRSVIPQVTSQFAMAGRGGDSPIAQQAIAKGIADAVAPYQFNSAEANANRLFQGGAQQQQNLFNSGATLAGQLYNSGENQAQRQYAGGESYANRDQAAADAQAARQFEAGGALASGLNAASADKASRQFSSGADLTSRLTNSGESALSRGLSNYTNERSNQLNQVNNAGNTYANAQAPAQTLLNLGSMQEDKSSQNLQDAINRFNFGQNLPQQKLADYMSMISGNYGQAGTNVTNATGTTQTSQPFFNSLMSGISGVGGLYKGAPGASSNSFLGK